MFFVLLIFITGTLVIGWVSRASLRSRQAHGFYRFFAWEGLLALFLLNLNSWFADPLSWHQLLSWLLLCLSLYLVVSSLTLLHRQGGHDSRRSQPDLLELEKTAHLVTAGVYSLIRHPMYCSLLSLGWGIFFKQPGWLGLTLTLLVSFLLDRTARAEEAEDLLAFGEEYKQYMRRTRRFIPFVY